MTGKKDYAVIAGPAVLKISGTSSANIAEKIQKAMKEGTILKSVTINPDTLEVVEDTLTLLAPGPGMVSEIRPWDAFIESHKQARAQRALQPKGQGMPILLQRPPKRN